MSDFNFSNRDLEEGLREFAKPSAQAPDDFNLKALADSSVADLKKFKSMRADMVRQKAELEAKIKIMDKRIDIALAAVTTLQKPV